LCRKVLNLSYDYLLRFVGLGRQMCEECIPKQRALLNVVLASARQSESLAEFILQVQNLQFFLDALDQVEHSEQLLIELQPQPLFGSAK